MRNLSILRLPPSGISSRGVPARLVIVAIVLFFVRSKQPMSEKLSALRLHC